jgi:DNA-binding MarR family transcriptional regulator
MSEIEEMRERDPVFRSFLLFMQTSSLVFKYSDARFFVTLGFTTSVFAILRGLANKKGTATHTELANWTNTEPHNITGIIRRMSRTGLTTTRRDTKDRRVVNVYMTAKGWEVWKKAKRIARINMKHIMQGIDNSEALELSKYLMKMKDNSFYEKSRHKKK